jgi:hypothetical protein
MELHPFSPEIQIRKNGNDGGGLPDDYVTTDIFGQNEKHLNVVD